MGSMFMLMLMLVGHSESIAMAMNDFYLRWRLLALDTLTPAGDLGMPG